MITLKHGDTLADSLRVGYRIQLYDTRDGAEWDMKFVLAREKQEMYVVKEVEVRETLLWKGD